MTTQPEALRLADTIEEDPTTTWGYREASHAAATELRRLHAVNQELLEALKLMLAVETVFDAEVAEDAARAAIAKAEGQA